MDFPKRFSFRLQLSNSRTIQKQQGEDDVEEENEEEEEENLTQTINLDKEELNEFGCNYQRTWRPSVHGKQSFV